MYYARGVNCCAEVRMLLNWDGGCPPAGPCRGVDEAGNCGELPQLFATTPVPPYFPNGLSEYTCHAFPDDDRAVDSFIVALIALAIALPVTQFIAGCFSVANDSECPESWLQWAGLARLLLGDGANRRWHYTGPAGPPSRVVRWYCRSVEAPPSETVANLWRSFRAWATGTRPPWIEEAEEAEEAERAAHTQCATAAAAESDDDDNEAAELTRQKHRLTVLGIVSVYLVWCAKGLRVLRWCVLRRAATDVRMFLAWSLCVRHSKGRLHVVHLHMCAPPVSREPAFNATRLTQRTARRRHAHLQIAR
jgi:hypothetical protein